MQVINRKEKIGYEPQLYADQNAKATIHKVSSEKGLEIFELTIENPNHVESVLLMWKLKGIGVKGSWTSNNVLDKRFRTDWEMPKLDSSIAVDAPILNLFGYQDENIITVGLSDLTNRCLIEGSLREEDNHFYFKIHMLLEKGMKDNYKILLYIDKNANNFSHSIQSYASWAINKNIPNLNHPPLLAKLPLYSTWYSFHQNLEEETLLAECQKASEIGLKLVIIDDGWQTTDDNRGYDYTGDWEAVRIPDLRGLVDNIHQMGMAVMLWYSVPFCGQKSKAYQKFKGKFLTENHHWAPVFDVRFPEVREYIVNKYATALLEWDLDGFKLDFIDDFKVYPETETQELNGRDTLSVAQGVESLITEIKNKLTTIKPAVLIEFRQQYINPVLRKLGNMFRAFDCPNDSLMNRVRTVDVKLLCGESIVHSDMITWHKEEPVQVAALQLSSIIFSVPQISVRLLERSADEIAMIKFFTNYCSEHKSILLDGKFTALKPLANYPILKAEDDNTSIYGIYEEMVLSIELDKETFHIVNGKLTEFVILDVNGPQSVWNRKVVNCLGVEIISDEIEVIPSLNKLECPANGIIFLTKKA